MLSVLSGSLSKLRMHAQRKDRNRPTVPVIGRVGHVLVVRGQREVFGEARRIERLQDILRPVMRQLPVADENAQAAGSEIGARRARDAVGHGRQAKDVVRAIPSRALEGKARRSGAVDVGEVVRFLAAVVVADARKCTEVGADFLLEVESDAGSP